MTQEEIYGKLVRILSEQLNVEADSIKEESLLADDLGADSLDTAEIAMMINDEFGYNLKDDEIAKIKTVGDIMDLLDGTELKDKE